MTVRVKGESGKVYEFEGPYPSTSSLRDRSGVYVILCQTGDKLRVIDVGESARLRTRVETHDRKECWEDECRGHIKYAAYYIEHGKKPSRVDVERDIRNLYDPPCGEQ